MRCSDVRDLLQPFLDGELEVDRNVEVLKHLELCAPCQRRSEEEAVLGELVVGAGPAAIAEADRQRLLEGAYARLAGGGGPAAPVRSWRRPLLAAAAALLLGTGGWLIAADPSCWRGCPTETVVAAAHEALREEPQPVDEVECALKRRIAAPCFPEDDPVLAGANVLYDAKRVPSRPVVRYRCADGKQLCLFVIPSGHHHGRVRVLPDGMEYVVMEVGDLRCVAWYRADGALEVCVPCVGLSSDEDRFLLLASALRHNGGSE